MKTLKICNDGDVNIKGMRNENDDSFQHNFNDNAFNTELDNSGNQDHNAKENNLEEMKNSKKRKASDNKSQAWSDERNMQTIGFFGR
ncbi:hypothetical protein RhiirC2_844338 [Rhizophagus irregularis]|uniref:Uncharacterized protein n=1 Tax=Rhizophagus irregularis TaxID=588596 RepID=A0A2N1NU43_9GLOM|nr:hypothetical protein RhiirC2_844338 [Rhizophagus irregularis]